MKNQSMKTLSVLSFAACSFLFLFFEKDNIETLNSDREFEKFIKLFPERELPFSISLDDFDQKKNYQRDLVQETRTFKNKFLSDLKGALYSRIGLPFIVPIQCFKTDENIYVFIYSIHYSIRTQYRMFKCSTTDQNGNILNNFILGVNDCHQTKTSSINEAGVIKVTTFENDCRSSSDLYGLKAMRGVFGRKKKEIILFKINKKGAFEELKEPSTTARASL